MSWLHRTEPKAPEDVRLVMTDGSEIPVECVCSPGTTQRERRYGGW
jgi:hypothetical protein